MTDYYVYVYIDPRNLEEFYYGKGRGSRSMAHLKDQGDSEKAARIRQIKDSEAEPIIRIVACDLSEDQALLVESALIWKLGRRLTNKNAGHYVHHFRPQNSLHVKLPGFDFSRHIHFFNVGEPGSHRSWDDSRTYGFVSAGYGARYKQAAEQLQKGDLLAGYLSGHGYVGLGLVTATAVPARAFRVNGKPLQRLKLKATDIMHDSDDLEICEYVVRVDWIKSFPREEALWKQGLFSARQTRVSLENQPRTIRFLEQHWEIRLEDILAKEYC